jgi:hypothetical protein
MNVSTPSKPYPNAFTQDLSPVAPAETDGTGDATTAVSGDWVLQLAQLLIGRADAKLNQLMSDAQVTNNTSDVLAELNKDLAPYSNGMDHRKNANDGDNGATALNAENAADAANWNAAIEKAIQKVPQDSPIVARLKGLEFQPMDPVTLQPIPADSFICNQVTMSGLQGDLQKIQQSNDQDASMQTFLAQQAVSSRDETITLLSGIQQEFNKTLDQQVEKV